MANEILVTPTVDATAAVDTPPQQRKLVDDAKRRAGKLDED